MGLLLSGGTLELENRRVCSSLQKLRHMGSGIQPAREFGNRAKKHPVRPSQRFSCPKPPESSTFIRRMTNDATWSKQSCVRSHRKGGGRASSASRSRSRIGPRNAATSKRSARQQQTLLWAVFATLESLFASLHDCNMPSFATVGPAPAYCPAALRNGTAGKTATR